MFRISAYFQVLKSIAITMLVAGLPAAQAQAVPTAGSKRPATVPADYVVTPFGYFHSSCVMHLGNRDEVRRDENAIRHANGTFDSIQICTQVRYKPNGEVVTGNEGTLEQPNISGWVEYASTTTGTSFGHLNAYWTVPPAPINNDGQTVFLFPGLEDINNVQTILQPVLGWNSDYASAWGIASWNCCVNGTVFEATPARVNSGDTIYGYMSATCARGLKLPPLSCPTWDIVTSDLTSGKSSSLLNTSSFGQTFNWAFAGVLEVYNVIQCGDYPSNGTVSFYNLGLYDYKRIKIASPAWSVTNLASAFTPSCGYGGSLPQQLTLTY